MSTNTALPEPKAISSAPKGSFRHRRLSSPRSIRLLRLVQSPSLRDALHVTLAEASLGSANSQGSNGYEALSYVWGSLVGTIPISCDGQQLLVTPNCESALRHLRLAGQERVLWVDAICIDQGHSADSVKERNSQVALMGEIYQKAARTIIWLGPGNDFTTELMAHLERIGSCPSQRVLRKFLLFDSQLRQQGKIGPGSSALDHIFCHAWHFRIWTVQETSYSRDCHVMCGKQTISWEVYSKAARFLLSEEFIEDVDPQAHISYVGIDMRNTFREYLWGRVPSEREPSPGDSGDEQDRRVVSLSSCLAQCNKLQATEPRDKIYGLHALYTSLGVPLPSVDYSKPLPRIYEEATVAMIMWSHTLNVLGDACHHNSSLPSWVSDFSNDGIRSSTPSGNSTQGSKIIAKSVRTLKPRPGELCVRGKVVGKVVNWGDGNPDPAIFPTRPEHCQLGIMTRPLNGLVEDVDTLRLLVDKIRFFRELYRLLDEGEEGSTGDVEDTFLDVVNQKQHSEPNEMFDIILDILAYPDTTYSLRSGEDLAANWERAELAAGFTEWTAELKNCSIIAASLLSNDIWQDERSLDYSSDLIDLITQWSADLNDKALIMVHLDSLQTTTLATGVALVQEGDSVVLLEGANWPVVLREGAKGKCHFVGPAFVPSIMDGALWDNIEGVGGTLHLTDFCLI